MVTWLLKIKLSEADMAGSRQAKGTGPAKLGPAPATAKKKKGLTPVEKIAMGIGVRKNGRQAKFAGVVNLGVPEHVATLVDNDPREGYEETLRMRLAKVREVDAVYIEEEDGVVHVYSIVRDMADYYDRLMTQEAEVAKAWPRIKFDFHVRAHQGRQPSQAAPRWARSIFIR